MENDLRSYICAYQLMNQSETLDLNFVMMVITMLINKWK